MKKIKILSLFLCLVLVLTSVGMPIEVSAQGTKTVKNIELNVASKQTMYVGTSKKIEVKRVTPKGASKKVTFESNNPLVVKVTKNGTMKALKEGKATVTVTSKENSKVQRKIKVTVKNLVKNSTKNKIALPMKNKTYKLKTAKKITLSKLKFSSNKKSVATVSKKGAITVKKPGVVKITIKGKKGNVKGAKQTITVYVAKKAVKNIKLNAKNIKLHKSETYQLKATVLPKDSCEEVFYASSDESVASVSEDGKVTAVGVGVVTVTTTTLDGNKTAECIITVEKEEKPAATATATPEATATPKATATPVVTAIPEATATATATPIATLSATPVPTVTPGGSENEITYREPVTLEELEAKFPKEPEYPALDLQDNYTMEVALKEDLLSLDVEAGTIVKTSGYYKKDDGGQAVYEIMTYDEWWEQTPIELKMVYYHTDRIGADQILYKNPADNYGNHRLKNGMVAKILPNEDGYVRVEQWGLFPGRTDNNRALIHIFANNHTDSKILFAKDAKYELYYDRTNQAYKNQNGIVNMEKYPWLPLENIGSNGNEYALLLRCRYTAKPVLGDAQNVELCGNGATIKIADNEYWKDGTVDFGMFETGGNVDGLKIHGFIFDSNGLNQNRYYDEKTGTYKNIRTTNHTLVFASAGIGYSGDAIFVDGNGERVLGEDFKRKDLRYYNGRTDFSFDNVEIYGNTFLDAGTSIDTSDGGGDHILIINPDCSKNVSIHNNKMYNWGRWVFAVDLGGNGERFYNYSFKQNICIQDETNVTYTVSGDKLVPTNKMRGLGWIDFEARKCFTNLDVSENYVYGANGWAFNGNGKISENITINANRIQRAAYAGYTWRSIYPYSNTFYSVYAKDLKITNNQLGEGSKDWGGLAYNLRIENNNLGGSFFVINRPLGNVVVKNNQGVGASINRTYWIKTPDDLPWIDNPESEFYVAPENRKTSILFENNGVGGIEANIVASDDETDYRKNITLDFKNNKFNVFKVTAWGVKDFNMTVDQLEPIPDFNNASIDPWYARGASAVPVEAVHKLAINPIPGGMYYEEGDLVSSTIGAVDSGKPFWYTEYYRVLFTDWMEYTLNREKSGDMYCAKAGIFPVTSDKYFKAESTYEEGVFVYTADNMYYVKKAGKVGTNEPTHTEGIVSNGTAELMWIAPIARYEMREKGNQSE